MIRKRQKYLFDQGSAQALYMCNVIFLFRLEIYYVGYLLQVWHLSITLAIFDHIFDLINETEAVMLGGWSGMRVALCAAQFQ